MKKIMTSRFGEIEAEEESIIHFAAGIPAFEEEREFIIIPYEEDSPYVFLQSVRTPELAFLMTMPLTFWTTSSRLTMMWKRNSALHHPRRC